MDTQDELFETLTLTRSLKAPMTPAVGGYGGRNTHCGGLWFWSWCWKSKKPKLDIEWSKDGVLHRLYGPAFISENYDLKMWYKDGKLHRTDGGPALQHKSTSLWFKEGKLHRIGGPAVVEQAGPKQFWIEGSKVSPKEYKKQMASRYRRGLLK